MSKIVDVTKQVDFHFNDDEWLPITKCVCGEKFSAWDFIISIYEDSPYKCPKCGAKLFWGSNIKVYQIIEDEDDSWDEIIDSQDKNLLGC